MKVNVSGATITYDLIMPLDRFIAFALSIVSSTYM